MKISSLLICLFTLSFGYAQSKKKQIEILNVRIDSLNQIISQERQINSEKSFRISQLDSLVSDQKVENSKLNSTLSSLRSEVQKSNSELSKKEQELTVTTNEINSLIKENYHLLSKNNELELALNEYSVTKRRSDYKQEILSKLLGYWTEPNWCCQKTESCGENSMYTENWIEFVSEEEESDEQRIYFHETGLKILDLESTSAENEFIIFCKVNTDEYPELIIEIGYFHVRIENNTLEFLTNESSEGSNNLGRFWSGKLTKCKN
jgi:hypothetical protein